MLTRQDLLFDAQAPQENPNGSATSPNASSDRADVLDASTTELAASAALQAAAGMFLACLSLQECKLQASSHHSIECRG